jgi:hypothetical protein
MEPRQFHINQRLDKRDTILEVIEAGRTDPEEPSIFSSGQGSSGPERLAYPAPSGPNIL